MRGFATGVGSKADIGAPPEEHDTTATHRHPWWAGERSSLYPPFTLPPLHSPSSLEPVG